jgi:tripartite-type tricarboxylate transporter receptor subunit TctC
VVLPYLGILIYLIARGHGMGQRAVAEQARMQEQMNERIRSVAGSSGGTAADQIAQAKSLLDSGAISQAEFDSLKAKALS